MRKTTEKTLYAILAVMLLQGCRYMELLWDPPAMSSNFSINNMSEDTLTAYLALGMENGCGPTLYPDTCLPKSVIVYDEVRRDSVNYIEEEIYNHAVPPHSCKTIHWLPGDLRRIMYCDTLSVFIISRDTLMKYGYDDIRRNYRVLVRYDLGWDEVKYLNFTFHYPPIPDMKYMKMCPPYEFFVNK